MRKKRRKSSLLLAKDIHLYHAKKKGIEQKGNRGIMRENGRRRYADRKKNRCRQSD